MAYATIPSILESISIPIYVVGTAYDGPDSAPFGILSNYKLMREIEKISVPVTITMTGTTLKVPATPGTVYAEFIPWSSPKFIPTYWVDDDKLCWKPLGSSGTLFAKYKPLQPDDAILPVANELSYDNLFALRVKGEKAHCTLDGWEFTSLYPGEIYNGMIVSGNSTKLVISGDTVTEINHLGNTGTLLSLLETYTRQNLPFTYSVGSSIPTGSASFASGTNGTLTDTSFKELLENIGGAYVGILLPAKPVTKQQIIYFQETNAAMGYPMVLVATPESLDISGLSKTPDVILVYGTMTRSDGSVSNLPASVAYIQYLFNGSTNFRELSTDKLQILSSQGIVGFGRYGPYTNQALDGSQPLYKLIIGWILRENYSGLIGKSSVDLKPIDDASISSILALPFVKKCNVTSRRSKDTIEVGAVATLFGEVRELVINVRAQ